MAEAQRIHNSEHYDEITQDVNGYTGRRTYKVNTGDVAEAMMATGLPALGEPWNAALPQLVVTRIGPVNAWAHKPATSTDNGWCYIPVEYSTPSGGGTGRTDPPPAPNLRHTVLTYTERQTTVYKGLVPNSNDPNPSTSAPAVSQTGAVIEADDGTLLIGDGEGAPKSTAATVCTVHAWHAEDDPFAIEPLIEASTDPPVNDDQVQLPAIYGSGQPMQCAKGTLRFVGYELTFESGLWHLQTKFERAVNHYHYWAAVNEKGQPAAEKIYASKVYRNAPFQQLLP